jgi:hypothetical protein
MDVKTAKDSKRRAPEWRVLHFVAIVFFTLWLIAVVLLKLIHASWQQFVGSVLLFGGYVICWVVTVFVLKRKNPDYVTELLKESAHEESKSK